MDGNKNSLSDTTATTASTINFSVLGNGGANAVNVTKADTSKITVAIGVDGTANAPAGGNMVNISNISGTNSVAIGGTKNSVTLNGQATNTVMFTAGGNTANIGSPTVPGDDDLFGNKATVTFAGTGNT